MPLPRAGRLSPLDGVRAPAAAMYFDDAVGRRHATWFVLGLGSGLGLGTVGDATLPAIGGELAEREPVLSWGGDARAVPRAGCACVGLAQVSLYEGELGCT